ncbi:FAD-dependent thymidylate synthase [Pseudomonas phage VCM]|uniref:FAD-dependent thymidylate synthase n=1 Tax=Pseudomonas phage VCM TaxID=1729937 RepID=A0A0S4KYX8_9CAUD|nr:FAD-dependent thymidylate synthase [Pseudomonas phage VCM]CUR44270.1 FAD-dependent thymidylate synthase [Pseudomonas phage VCM]
MTITAKIIAHSIAPNGQMIVTWELEYQRFIHGEFMTHRLFSRNAASSRAIPVATIIKQVEDTPAMPIHWGKNQSGMQAKESLSDPLAYSAKYLWLKAAKYAANIAGALTDVGLHKQATNRILEPFQTMKTVMTATCMDNFFWLRNHEDAQPEIKELARLMWEALQASTPNKLNPGDWHVPYYNDGAWVHSHNLEVSPVIAVDRFGHTLENALAISSSCCAQVSYRKLDDTLEKAQMVYKRLVDSEPVHASPFEHQATPIEVPDMFCEDCQEQSVWEDGVTHVDRNKKFWSGNFIGWIQHRQLIPNNVCMKYEVSNG